MSWIIFIAFGFIVGLLARALVPGKQAIGWLWTTVLGVAGALIGGFVVQQLTGAAINDINLWSFVGALIGAVVLLMGYIAFARRSGPGRTIRPRHERHA